MNWKIQIDGKPTSKDKLGFIFHWFLDWEWSDLGPTPGFGSKLLASFRKVLDFWTFVIWNEIESNLVKLLVGVQTSTATMENSVEIP